MTKTMLTLCDCVSSDTSSAFLFYLTAIICQFVLLLCVSGLD